MTEPYGVNCKFGDVMIVFDTRGFLRNEFPDLSRLRPFVASYGEKVPSDEAVRKWAARGSIPAEWFALLIGLLELDRGAPVSLASYLKMMP